jgi:hypothetical protein
MHGDLLLVVVILVFGCAAFLFGVIYLVCSVIGFVGRGVLGLFKPDRAPPGRRSGVRGAGALVCPREECRKVEYRDAKYCSQCGAPLRAGRRG